MADATAMEDDVPKKASKLPLILGLVLALLGGGAGFYATWSGLFLGPETEQASAEKASDVKALPDIQFVELEPLVVSITGAGELSHLRFRAQLEVPSMYKADVELLEPRIIDVLNGYLRALRTSDIEDTSALARLRAQMLRRVQVVIGPDRINDLLIMEFVIN
jgi:flagellar FliL protein